MKRIIFIAGVDGTAGTMVVYDWNGSHRVSSHPTSSMLVYVFHARGEWLHGRHHSDRGLRGLQAVHGVYSNLNAIGAVGHLLEKRAGMHACDRCSRLAEGTDSNSDGTLRRTRSHSTETFAPFAKKIFEVLWCWLATVATCFVRSVSRSGTRVALMSRR